VQGPGQQHAQLAIGRCLASLPGLLHLTVEAAQVDKIRDLVVPEIVIVQQRITNGRNLDRLLRRASGALARPGRRHHRRGAKHHRVAQHISTVRGSIPLIEQPKCLGRGLVQLTDYATKRRPRPALAPLPAAELRPGEDQVGPAEPAGDLLGLAGGLILRPAAALPFVHEALIWLPAALSWHRAAPLGGGLRCLHCTASSDKRRGPAHPPQRCHPAKTPE
jgi:hypothetical protein